jgi:hydrogenase-4 component B
MNTIFHLSLLLTFTLFVLPKRWKYGVSLILHLMLVISTVSWAIDAFYTNEVLTMPLGISSWNGSINLVIDKLSAFFIVIINLITFAGFIYAGGYLKPYIEKKRAVTISLHLFSLLWLQGAMILVASVHDGIAFLLSWELMSLFSFILVIFEGEKEKTLRTGINYLLQMHLGFALIMFGFLILKNATGNMSFEGLEQYFNEHQNTGLYLIFFAGFGIKAGFIPLHTWLPKAHPAAPSHVSGIMSGVMIKLGIYGILRVTSFIHHDLAMIGSIVLIISIISGIVGVLLAIVQHDLKRLLAYHSIENIGIIGIGIGTAILGAAVHDPILTSLGLAGALLHVVNHALFKSLLFFATGNVYHSTHTVNMDELGGIARGMRLTSIVFLIGALAISGIPPFNGFISEFLIYSGVIKNLVGAGFSMSLAGLAALVSLVLIGGLCLYCFTKAFGLTFLGTRRGHHAKATVTEVPLVMLIPLFLLVAVIIGIGFFPGFFLIPVQEALAEFKNLNADQFAIQQTVASLRTVGTSNALLTVVIVAIVLVRYWQQSKKSIEVGPTWGCGYSAGDFRHQYTPTSYADTVRQLSTPFIAYEKNYKPIEEEEIFPHPREFHTENYDRIEKNGIAKLIGLLITYLPKAGFTQTGYIHHYLIYPLAFLLILGLLTFLNYL